MKSGGYRRRGFSLIELMMVVVVVGVLTLIAYPSYKSFVVRTSREAAESQLQELANLQEKIFLTSNAYTTRVTDPYNGQSGGGLGLASGQTVDSKYDIAFTTSTATEFTLRARPVSTTTQDGDGDIFIDHTGKRTWDKNGAGTLVPW